MSTYTRENPFNHAEILIRAYEYLNSVGVIVPSGGRVVDLIESHYDGGWEMFAQIA